MSDQRVPIWAADADLDDYDELNFVIGNYAQNNFEDGALRPLVLLVYAHNECSSRPASSSQWSCRGYYPATYGTASRIVAGARRCQDRKFPRHTNLRLSVISICSSSSYAFTRPSWIIISKKSQLHMRVVGINTRRNFTPGQSGPRQRSLHL